MSNDPTHILEGILKNNINRLTNEEVKKQTNNQHLQVKMNKET